jgi:hypothetical protein
MSATVSRRHRPVEAEINPSTPGKMRIKPVALIGNVGAAGGDISDWRSLRQASGSGCGALSPWPIPCNGCN